MASNVRIEITAHDGTKQVFESVEGRLKMLGAAGKSTVSSFEDIGRSAAGMSNAISHVIAISNSFEIRQLRMEQATERVRVAQENETQALIEYGPASEQAAAAAFQRESAERALERTVASGTIATVASIAQIVSLTAQAPAAGRALLGMAVAARAAAVGMSALQIAATGGLAAITIIGGYVAFEAVLRGTGDEADHTKTKVQQLREELELMRSGQSTQLQVFPAGSEKSLEELDLERKLVVAEEAERRKAEGAATAQEERRAAFVESVAFEESVRAVSLAKDRAFFAEELDQVRASVREKQALLSEEGRFSDVNQWNEQMKELQVLNARQGVLERGLTDVVQTETRARDDARRQEAEGIRIAAQVAEEAAQRAAAAQQQIVTSLTGGLGQVGAGLSKVTLEAQQRILELSGVGKSLQNQLLGNAVAEERLTAAALKSSEALRGQADITAKKDETVEEFTRRLLTMGFTEAEVTARLDVASRQLLSQEEAARRTASGFTELQRSLVGLNVEELTTHFGPRVLRLMEEMQEKTRETAVAFNADAASIVASAAAMASVAPQIPAAAQAQVAEVSLPPSPQAPVTFTPTFSPVNPGAVPWTPPVASVVPPGPSLAEIQAQAQRAQVARAIQESNAVLAAAHRQQEESSRLLALTASVTPSTQTPWRLIRAAHGFHGDVDRPTLFLGGEAGRERVDITPRGDGGGRGVMLVQHFHGPADPVEVGRVVERSASVLQKRLDTGRF